jgi:hypothetical protein
MGCFDKIIGILAPSLIFGAISVFAHEGRTPFSVLKDMKQKKTGPYASPLIMGNKTLVNDWLGIRAEDISDAEFSSGVLIVEIREGGVADEEGLEKGDIIIGVNTAPIRSRAELEKFLEGIQKPDVFTFRLIRDDDDEDVYLDNNLAEMDEEMTTLILSKSKEGEFEKGMLMKDMMARSPLGTMDGRNDAISPQAIMQQMMAKTPMGQRGAFPENMKNLDMSKEQSVLGFARGSGNKSALSAPAVRDKKKRTDTIFFFHKAAYQIAVDKKIRIIQHPQSLKKLAVSPDQKEEITKLNRTVKKYLIKQDALLAIARLDIEGVSDGAVPDQATDESLVGKYRQLREEKYIRLVRFIVEFERFLDHKQKGIFRSLVR